MKIVNFSQKTNLIRFYIEIFIIAFLYGINILTYVLVNAGDLSFFGYFIWLGSMIKSIFIGEGIEGIVIIFGFSIALPLIFLACLIYDLIIFNQEKKEMKNPMFIKFLTIDDLHTEFHFADSTKDFVCPNSDISSCSLEIITDTTLGSYGSVRSIIKEIAIEIIYQGKLFKINNVPKQLYSVIRELARYNSFSYSIVGTGVDIHDALRRNIDEFLSNGFIKPNIHKALRPLYIGLEMLFVGLFIYFGWMGLYSFIVANSMWGLSIIPIALVFSIVYLLFLIIKNK